MILVLVILLNALHTGNLLSGWTPRSTAMRVQLAATSPDDWDAPPAPSEQQRRSPAHIPTPIAAAWFLAALALAPAPWLLVLLHVRRELDLPVSDVPWLMPQLVGQFAAALALGRYTSLQTATLRVNFCLSF